MLTPLPAVRLGRGYIVTMPHGNTGKMPVPPSHRPPRRRLQASPLCRASKLPPPLRRSLAEPPKKILAIGPRHPLSSQAGQDTKRPEQAFCRLNCQKEINTNDSPRSAGVLPAIHASGMVAGMATDGPKAHVTRARSNADVTSRFPHHKPGRAQNPLHPPARLGGIRQSPMRKIPVEAGAIG